MRIYTTDFLTEYKADHSPVTLADKNADAIIRSFLDATGIYIMSEEEPVIPFEQRKDLRELWIVDPLDGTKEFVKKNGEFTVNIALVRDGVPVLGVVAVPASGIFYAGWEGSGSYRFHREILENSGNELSKRIKSKGRKLPQPAGELPFRVIGSRSHSNAHTAKFMEKIARNYFNHEIITAGSSLKLCMVAEGSADVYPRFSPISEWDTAAGHAIILHSGGRVYNYATNKPITYNKENLLQPWFIAVRKDLYL